jgi:hypothetical protein
MAAILLGLLGVLALVMFLNGRGEDEPDPVATGTTLGESSLPGTEEPAHQIPPLDGCSLISADEVGTALGLDPLASLVQFGRGEGCLWQPSDADSSATDAMVELVPGQPEDFEAGATLVCSLSDAP